MPCSIAPRPAALLMGPHAPPPPALCLPACGSPLPGPGGVTQVASIRRRLLRQFPTVKGGNGFRICLRSDATRSVQGSGIPKMAPLDKNQFHFFHLAKVRFSTKGGHKMYATQSPVFHARDSPKIAVSLAELCVVSLAGP